MCDQPTTDKPRFINPEKICDSEVYRALMALYMQRDKLSWSRTRALGVVEGGVIAASFVTRGLLASAILVFGIAIVVSIWFLIERDWQCRDRHFKDALDSVHSPRNIALRPAPGILTETSLMPGLMRYLSLVN